MAKKSKTGALQRFVPPKQASERLGVTTQTLRNWSRKGKIDFITLPSGRRHYDVDGLMAAMRASPPVEPPAPVERAPEAPRPVMVTPEIALNPLALALARILSTRPMDAQAQIAALLNANRPVAEPEAPVNAAPILDVKAAIEAIAGAA